MTKKLDGKVALVTGASRGIGYAISKVLAAQGAHIVAVARTIGGLEDLDDDIKALGSSATLVPLDLTDYDGIDRMGKAIYERFDHLDILVGNAGILGVLSPLGHIEPKVWDDVMALNVTANWRLIRSFDPLLKRAENGRAVFLSSGAAFRFKAYWGAYATSKAALEALVKTYAAECTSNNINVNLLNPGPIATALRAKAMPGEDSSTIPSTTELANAMLEMCLPEMSANGEVFDFADGKISPR
ncbi:MAG TPA: SDR family NAD(P)-dependent oxidoreductase [Rhizobiales bacterium]|nr:SDR family NAD(P)-dependent oxidoreductase [Hyphomicrobiales bacterium]